MQLFLHFFGLLVILAGVTLNLNTMLYKAADIYRGQLTGSELEWALLNVTAMPAAALLTFGYVYYQLMRSYKKRVLKECTKCDCKNCGRTSSSSGRSSG